MAAPGGAALSMVLVCVGACHAVGALIPGRALPDSMRFPPQTHQPACLGFSRRTAGVSDVALLGGRDVTPSGAVCA